MSMAGQDGCTLYANDNWYNSEYDNPHSTLVTCPDGSTTILGLSSCPKVSAPTSTSTLYNCGNGYLSKNGP